MTALRYLPHDVARCYGSSFRSGGVLAHLCLTCARRHFLQNGSPRTPVITEPRESSGACPDHIDMEIGDS